MAAEITTYVHEGDEVIPTGRIATSPVTNAVTFIEVSIKSDGHLTKKWVKYNELHAIRLIKEDDIET